jgi:hypothetical protein
MVRQRKERRNDVKKACEDAMKLLGYEVSNIKTTKLEGRSCFVTNNDFNSEVASQFSYINDIPVKIEFNVDDNDELPYEIMKVQAFVTWYVENSGTGWCTTFYFNSIQSMSFDDSTHNVSMYGLWRAEVDWLLTEIDWCGDETLTTEQIQAAIARAQTVWSE